MTIIKRKRYLDKLNIVKDKPIIKVITGQRRVGKSCLLRSFINELKTKKIPQKNIIYINKEDLAFDKIRNFRDLDYYIISQTKKSNPKKKIYLLIDEVQEIDQFEKVVRSYALREDFDIYISGSNSKIVSSELSTFLSGRYVEIYVSPLTYDEFLIFAGLTNDQEVLKKYLRYGGMPFIHKMPLNDELVFTYAKNVYNTILLKDIVEKFEIRNVDFLKKLVLFLSNNIGYPFSANSISRYLKSDNIDLAPSVIIEYLEALRSSYFLHKVQRFDLAGKKIFKTNAKYYFNDLGIINAIAGGWRENSIGQLIENVIFLHLLARGYEVFVGKMGNKEIDFVVRKNQVIKYFQVALTVYNQKTYQREFGNLAQIKDNYEKYVITMDEVVNDFKGVKGITLNDFLLKFK